MDSFYHMTLYYCEICCHRVSVHPSVTSRYCVKTAKYRITQITPHESPGTPVSNAKDLRKIPPGSTPMRAPNAGEWAKIGDF